MAGHVLVADGALTTRILLKAILGEAHYDVSLVCDRASAESVLRHHRPGVVILGQALADGPGEALLERIRARPETRAVPVIMLSDNANAANRIAALSAGADEMMSKPISEATLLARLRSLLRAYDTETALGDREGAVQDMGFSEARPDFVPPARISTVGTDTAQSALWSDALAPHLTDTVTPLAPAAALSAAPADIYVIAATPEPEVGLRLLAELRARPATRHAAIVLVHDHEDTETAVTALDLGASDLIASAFDPTEMALRLQIQLTRKRSDDRLRASVEDRLRMAVVDPLTGLFNRRYADAHAERTVARARDTDRPYAVILADIDRFKLVNDGYGHGAGDTVLTEVARRLKDNLRPNDMIARIGGEEFVVIMPDITTDSALTAAQRLCDRVREGGVRIPGCPTPLGITVSLGLAIGMPGESYAQVIGRADGALYDAKEAGRDTVTVCAPHAA
ncbi:MAG: diguanylate cyclase [Pseudomonadota bacterium]